MVLTVFYLLPTVSVFYLLFQGLIGEHVRCEAEAIFAVNECLSGLYSEGLFIKSPRARFLARRGLEFLQKYAKLALLSFRQRKRRYPFMPKGHYLHHQLLSLYLESERGGLVHEPAGVC